MKRWSRLHLTALCLAAAPALVSCNTVGFGVVSIRPIYGWVDGCTPVSVGGHGFGDDVAVTIGGSPLENVTLPTAADSADATYAPLDVGYEVYGTTPAGAQSGYAEVKVTSGGEEGTVNGDFYYAACPMGAYPEGADPSADVTAGSTITLSGCNLVAGYTVKVGPSQAATLASVCKSATATFAAPVVDTALGTDWYIAIFDTTGAQVYPDLGTGCDTTLPPGSQAVTVDTGVDDPCAGVLMVSYAAGGA